jgi:chromosomal replication initiator protein
LGQLSTDKTRADEAPNEATSLGGFVAGPENHLVEIAVRSVLQPSQPDFCPILLYGSSGTGKTHLARGVHVAWKTAYPRHPAVYVPAVDFARELADAIDTQTVDDFASHYRELALLIIDDLHLLRGKTAAQEELLHTVDALLDAEGRILMTSRCAPAELKALLPGLLGRILAGLAVPVVPPGLEARLTLLKQYARGRSVVLPDSAARLLARELVGTAPELSGALNRLELSARVDDQTIDAEAIRLDLSRREDLRKPTVHQIALATAKQFAVTLRTLRSASRRRAVVAARGVAMYLARNLTNESLSQIGQYFGGRDHTTVSYGCHKIEEMLKDDSSMRQAVVQLKEAIQSGRTH